MIAAYLKEGHLCSLYYCGELRYFSIFLLFAKV